MIKFYSYKKCSTCRKAEKFFQEHEIEFEFIDIVENPPPKSLLKNILKTTDLPIKKLINTSGQVYREKGLKDLLPSMTQQEIIAELSANGKLVKRPLAFDGETATVGFREDEYLKIWKN